MRTVSQNQVRLSAATPVRAAAVVVTCDVSMHDHEFTEICVVECGTAAHLTEAAGESTGNVECGQLESGRVIIVPPGPAHAFESPRGLRVINVYYLAEWFLWDLNLLWQNEGVVPLFFASHLFRGPGFSGPGAARIEQFTLSPAELAACLHELNDIETEGAAASPSAFWVRGAFSKLLVILSRAWMREVAGRHGLEFHRDVWAAIQQVDDRIKEGRPFSVEAFARTIGRSADGFTRSFRAATGLAPSEYFQSRRVQHAGHLLLRSELSMSEIAFKLGYADGAHLTRFFRKHHGCSPSEFRKRYRP